ncbi:sensor histidine kinase [Paenibacillus sp. PL91]|uniref:sensor histidine kinase n=1 Tax=Paenibacillus sp. PL91 TaxID=2729538 RepID=UPI00145F2948|nr:HAMP domain-containing sensor histidine kinase [Paenibacillus sp. PL91]MBC9201329.1 HAMP domain-containing histidine kinase [Paenibacillus sp. PL91]
MKLRSYLLLANTISIAFIIILLLAFYRFMLLSKEQFIWLTLATVGAGLVSGLLHFLLVRPLEASVRRIGEGAGRIAAGDLEARVEHAGLKEFKQLAEQFNHMGVSLGESFRQVKAAESAQRELVANMAHDLRTPLASVQSYVEALEDGVIQDEETFKRYLGTIRSETIRLGELIQDLFELSTLDAESREPKQLRPAIVEDVLVELLPRFTKPLDEKSLQLRVKLPEYPLRLTMQPRHLQRVLQNLLENAIRHSPQGGLILIEAKELQEESGKLVGFTVSDEGEGVPEAERERIFERFYRSDRSRSRESGGAGLGLSIAKLLVEQYGGSIGVQQSGVQGSSFWFTVRELAEGVGKVNLANDLRKKGEA